MTVAALLCALLMPSDAAAEQASSSTRAFASGKIEAGGEYTCAILSNNTVRCWGDAANGRLGYGNTNDIGDNELPSSAGPVSLGAGRTPVALAAGEAHTCALLDNATVRCWGYGIVGALGYANTNDIGDDELPSTAGPVDLGAGRTAVAITAGDYHTCALLDDGNVRCWGYGDIGALGYGNHDSVGDDETPGSVGPVDLGAGRTAVKIAAGAFHTCAQLDNGTVRCWGYGANGQLGYANTNTIGDDETPGSIGTVNIGSGRTAVALTGGGSHTCAVLDNATLRCWGNGSNGRLGYGNTNTIGDNETPGSIGTVNVGSGRTVLVISAGDRHTCAVLDNNTMRCWGEGDNGRLGYASTSDIGNDETPGSVGTVNLGTGRTAITVATGDAHTCAVLDNSTVRCWGEGDYGRLGYANTNDIGDNETPGSVGTVSLGSNVDTTDDPPTAVSDSATTFEDSAAAAIDVLANDTNPDGGPKTISSATDPAGGTVVLTGGTAGAHTGLTYQPDNGYCNDGAPPDDTFNYTLNGGSTATVSVAVTCVGTDPAGVDDSATVAEDSGANAIDVLANDTDPDGGPKNIASATDPANGTVVLTGGTPGAHTGLTYEPDPDYCNDGAPPDDTFTYTLNGGSTATVSVAVTCVDDAPTAVDDSFTGHEDSGFVPIDVLVNDTDSDGGSKTVQSASDPANGTVAVAPGGTGVSYSPDPSYCNDSAPPDTFTYTLNGGSTATVSVAVSCTDDPPTGVDDSAAVAEDSGETAIPVLGNDTDIDAGLKVVSSATDPANGTVVVAPDGLSLTYEPDPDYCNDSAPADTFTYTLNGGSTATVSVAVSCIDDDPVAVDDSATTGEDSGPSAVDVLANDTDVDGGVKTVQAVSDASNGTVSITGGGTGLTYEPDPDYCNDGPTPDDIFTYTLNGGTQATVSMAVSCSDDDPAAVDDQAATTEDSAPVTIDVLANDADADGGPMTIQSSSDPANGTVVVAPDGLSLTYEPDPDYCNDSAPADTFTYTLNGGSTATVSVAVGCVDDPPTAVDDLASGAEDSAAFAIDVLANDTNTDGGPKTISTASDPANGDVVLTGGTPGAHTGLTYQPDPGYCNDSAPLDTFSYTLNGGSMAMVSVAVSCADVLPTAVDDSASGAQDSPAYSVLVLANDTDPDGGPMTISSASDPANGDVVLTGGIPGAHTGLTYQPDPGYCNDSAPPDTFTYTLNGGSTATVSVAVACAAAPPPTADPPIVKPGEQRLHVHRLVVPKTASAMIRKGIRVLASCELDCKVILDVTVRPSTATKLRLSGLRFAHGAVTTAAGERRWVIGRLTRSAKSSLRTYGGGGRLRVKVRAVEP